MAVTPLPEIFPIFWRCTIPISASHPTVHSVNRRIFGLHQSLSEDLLNDLGSMTLARVFPMSIGNVGSESPKSARSIPSLIWWAGNPASAGSFALSA